MTYTEYQKLYEEWKTCDSIERRAEIESDIRSAACAVLDKLNKIYAKWGKKFVEDDDYVEDRGYLGLIRSELPYDGKTTIHLHYSDRWKYGGECDFTITIPMTYLNESNVAALEAYLKSKRIAELEKDIQDMEAEIVNIINRKVELQKELEELKS